MRISELILKSTAFLVAVASEDESGIESDLVGTGFFFGIASDIVKPQSFFYFVTAKHILDGIKSKAGIRINLKNNLGSCVVIPDEWFFHPNDQSADVAIAPFLNKPEYDILFLDQATFLTRQAMERIDVGIGDEVYFPGLFEYAQGEHRNHPLVRCGNVAMLPTERVPTDVGMKDAILVEARSIGGISGSAVFVRRTMSLIWNDDAMQGRYGPLKAIHGLTGETMVIGMVYGHWDIKESEININRPQPNEKYGVNMGIAIVTPIEMVLATVHQQSLTDIRAKAEEDFVKQQYPTPD